LRPTDLHQPSAATPDEVMELVQRTRLSKPTLQEVVVDGDVAGRIGVEVGSRWQLLAGALVLRANPREVLCWSENYLPNVSRTEALRKGRFTLADVEGLTLEQVVSAEIMRPEVAERLGVASGSPALVVRRRHFNDEGRLIKIGLHAHPGDRYRVTTILQAPVPTG
jgi:GntR family transcriptional regulator